MLLVEQMLDYGFTDELRLRGQLPVLLPAVKPRHRPLPFLFFLMTRRPPRSTPYPHSFPTRRSSDLLRSLRIPQAARSAPLPARATRRRSEEHTSELQSHSEISYAVFCLKKTQQKPQKKQTVPPKKKNKTIQPTTIP